MIIEGRGDIVSRRGYAGAGQSRSMSCFCQRTETVAGRYESDSPARQRHLSDKDNGYLQSPVVQRVAVTERKKRTETWLGWRQSPARDSRWQGPDCAVTVCAVAGCSNGGHRREKQQSEWNATGRDWD